jgi:hypothetical protein
MIGCAGVFLVAILFSVFVYLITGGQCTIFVAP